MRIRILAFLIILACQSVNLIFAQEADTYLILADNPNGQMIAAAGLNGVVHILHIHSNVVDNLSQVNGATVLAAAWRPDGKRLATGNALGTVSIYCTDDTVASNCIFGNIVSSWETGQEDITNIAWSGDGNKIATSSQDLAHSLIIWDSTSYDLLAEDSGFTIMDIDWNPVTDFIAYADMNGAVGYVPVTEVSNVTSIGSFVGIGVNTAASAVAWNHTGSQLAIAHGSLFIPEIPVDISIWDINQNQITITSSANYAGVVGVLKWSQDDAFIATADFSGQIVILETTEWTVVKRYTAPQDGSISAIGLSWIGDTQQLAYGGRPGLFPTIVDISKQKSRLVGSGLAF